jgi:PAS domain S-box-containing protein
MAMQALGASALLTPLLVRLHSRRPGVFGLWGIGVVGAFTLGLTLAAWHFVASSERQRAETKFDARVQTVVATISARMAAYEQVLRGGVGLFDASQSVEREEWRAYVRALRVADNYPGILGIGYGTLIMPSERDAFVQRMRAEGLTDYRIWPEGERSEYAPVTYLERFEGPNPRVFGYDMMSESNRSTAMRRAWESGDATLTGVVKLATGADNAPLGLLMYLPIARHGLFLADGASRAAPAGFVYASFRLKTLMQSVLGDYQRDFALELRDGATLDAPLMFESGAFDASTSFSRTLAIQLYGRAWTLRLAALPGFDPGIERWKARAFLIAGTALTLLLMALMWAARGTRSAALRLAGDMTAALRTSEAKYRAIVEDQTELVCRFRPDGVLSFANDAYCRYVGRTAEELVGTPFLAESDHAAVTAPIHAPTAADPTATIEHRAARPGGEVRWHQWTKRALYDHDGKLLEYQVVGRDITEQKRAEEALRENRALLRAVIDAVPATINVKDCDGRYVLVNTALANYRRRAVDDFPGKTPADFYPESYVASVRARDAAIIATGVPTGLYELDYTDADGRARTWLATAVPLRDDIGAVKYVVSVGLDITPRKQAEEALRESRALLRAVIDAVPATIRVKDRDLRYVLVNQAFASYHNLPVEAFAGKSPADFYTAAYAQQVQARDARIIATGEPTGLHEVDYTERDGRQTTWLVTSVPLRDDGGAVKYVVGVSLDISQRKQAERALAASERNYRQLIETQTELITRFRPDTVMTFVNPAYCRYHGRPAEALLRTRWIDQVYADDRPAIEQFLLSLTPANPAGVCEHRVVLASGEVRWQQWSDTAHFDESGRALEYQSVGRDVTARKLAEQKLGESERRMRHLVESAGVVPYTWDIEARRYSYIGPQVERLFGHSPEQWMDTARWVEILHPDDRERVTCKLHEFLRRPGDGSMEYRMLRPDGSVVWVRDIIQIETDENGRRVGYGTVVDVTDSKLREGELRESENRLRHLVESAGVLPYTWDIEAQRYSYIGPQIEKLFGHSAEQWTNQALSLATVHPDDRARVKAWMQDSGENLHDSSLEYRLLRPDGSIIWVREIIKIETDQNGRRVGYGTVVDVTDSKLRDGQLLQAQKMEAVGQLTSGIAHDFNNLLMIVTVNLDMLLPRLDPSDSLARELAEGALAAGLDGGELTRQLLTYARRQPMQAVCLDLNALVTRSVGLLRRTLSSVVDIETTLADDLWPIESDPAQLEAALTNLAINARDAMPMGGRLTIETANLHLAAGSKAAGGELKPGDYVVLTVTDTGLGIPSDIIGRVFEPFFTTKPPGKGSGLGLSMIYGFAKQSDGHVEIESAVDRGTTVRLYLPRALRPAVRAPVVARRREPMPAAGELVLVVEDNATVRKSVIRQLQKLGYRTLEAEDGQQALDLLEREPLIDLLFSDVVMPGGMNGRQLAAAARRKRPGIKVLLTSGYPDKAGEARGGERKEQVFGKPYRQRDLALKLREILQSETV